MPGELELRAVTSSRTKHGRRQVKRANPEPQVVGGWGPDGPPAHYDPGAPTGPVEPLALATGRVGGTSAGRIAEHEVNEQLAMGITNSNGQMGYPAEVVPRAELGAKVSSGEGTELPHWADPPTGEVPRALAGPAGEDDELQAWRLLGSRGLHWRDDVNDWAAGPGVEDLVDQDEEPVGPPEMAPDDPYSFDDDFEHVRRVRADRNVDTAGATQQGTVPHGRNSDPTRSLYDAVPGAVPAGPQSADEPDAPASPQPGAEDEAFGGPPMAGPFPVRPFAAGQYSGSAFGGDAEADEEGIVTGSGPLPPPLASPPAGEADVPGRRGRATGGGRRRGPGGAARNVRETAPAPPSEGSQVATVVRTAPPRQTLGRPFDAGTEMRRGGGPGRDLGAAIATGAGLLLVFIGCYVIGPAALVGLAAVAIAGCALEAFAMLQRAGFRPATLLGALGSGGAVLAAYWRGSSALPVVLVVVLGASLVWYLGRVVEARPVVNVGVTILGFTWVGVLGAYSGLLLQVPYGKHLFVGAVVPTMLADVAAWFAGSRFGSHPMAPHTSPHKTWEGFAAGAAAALVAGAVVGKYLKGWGGGLHGLELGLVVAIVGPIGDLVQSMIKRDLRLKDSGTFLPGHGGLLDRFDALLFVLPATYFLAIALHLVR